MSKILSCPFCGSNNVVIEKAAVLWWVYCNNCHAHSRHLARPKRDVIANWNNKVDLVKELNNQGG